MCMNKRIQRCEVKRLRKKRGEKGFGLFADENIKKGEYVMEFTGKSSCCVFIMSAPLGYYIEPRCINIDELKENIK
jgi:hypothetical protein